MIDPMLHRDLGKLEGRLESLGGDITELRGEVNEIYGMLRSINRQLDAAGGSWKVMMGLAAISSAATAVLINLKKILGVE